MPGWGQSCGLPCCGMAATEGTGLADAMPEASRHARRRRACLSSAAGQAHAAGAPLAARQQRARAWPTPRPDAPSVQSGRSPAAAKCAAQALRSRSETMSTRFTTSSRGLAPHQRATDGCAVAAGMLARAPPGSAAQGWRRSLLAAQRPRSAEQHHARRCHTRRLAALRRRGGLRARGGGGRSATCKQPSCARAVLGRQPARRPTEFVAQALEQRRVEPLALRAAHHALQTSSTTSAPYPARTSARIVAKPLRQWWVPSHPCRAPRVADLQHDVHERQLLAQPALRARDVARVPLHQPALPYPADHGLLACMLLCHQRVCFLTPEAGLVQPPSRLLRCCALAAWARPASRPRLHVRVRVGLRQRVL